MHAELKGEVFRDGQGAARRQDTFDDRVVGEVQKHNDLLQHAGFIEGAAEIFGHVVLGAHSGKHDGKVVLICVFDLRLACNLDSKLIVLHAGTGEDGSFCPRINVISTSMVEMPVLM